MEIKRILISQKEPAGASPYTDLIAKWGLTVDFHPFFRVEGVSVRDFVAQRVTILDYTAIVFTSRTAIDSFFHICEQTRVAVPETMKYFCQSEAIAVYLQKYIVYRKRKIFFGSGTVASMVQAIGAKHRNENFLIACTDSLKPDVHKLFVKEKLKHGSAVFVRTVSNDLHDVDLHGYQIVAFYSPSDVKSLQESYPAFKQESLTFATYGPSTARAAEEAGLAVAIKAPAPGAPSIAEALNSYLEAGRAKG
ncbi:MAG: uroporphyrinogen-III synthase [Bacteroidales bacterium]|jgi:uroporphyrinogen-III synthase|nr:uroporphyrinogen-III synthase [Bacteroidales bacterium]MBQ1754428.1 uroporphyrinogen-III synthase [Bacteroidales bacterium]MBQ2194849.1 uroporphyrinogen-III synthase [Bacteroidales bacterium]MBQ3742986.1 uroporphyrinogen-III synthase [Bacteroidales bacterium]MBQ5434945.1 uroporphyrinogen-III synthase [Bacteroidales bacterium]